ncbi:MAG: PpiC-type peptidyl-prolyl cis-trans isomerase [Acidobacteriales bacterium]|nr:PpiC-type peptidyl-prolyl cis-trans isomerase [Terriglobales bacterium]
MKLSRIAPFIFLAATILPAAAQTVVEDIVARVNDKIITRSDLKRSREALDAEAKQPPPEGGEKKPPPKEKDLLRDLIDQQLLVQRGLDMGITADSDVIKRLDEIRKSMNLENMEDLEKAAQAQGISFEDFKNNMKNSIITQRVIGEEVGRRIQVPPTEIAEYYEKHKSEFQRPEQVALAEILVSTETKAPAQDPSKPAAADAPKSETPAPAAEDPAKIAAAETKAAALLDSIRKGAKFEDVAKKSSDGPTSAEGGNLGAFKRGALAKELEDKVFAMKTGDVSDVIRTKQGFIILKVVDHQSAGVPPMKEVETQINEALYFEKLQPALRAYLTKLREDAYIDIKPGFIDTGASPNQTKPIVVASAGSLEEQQQKKAKKKKKMLIF